MEPVGIGSVNDDRPVVAIYMIGRIKAPPSIYFESL